MSHHEYRFNNQYSEINKFIYDITKFTGFYRVFLCISIDNIV